VYRLPQSNRHEGTNEERQDQHPQMRGISCCAPGQPNSSLGPVLWLRQDCRSVTKPTGAVKRLGVICTICASGSGSFHFDVGRGHREAGYHAAEMLADLPVSPLNRFQGVMVLRREVPNGSALAAKDHRLGFGPEMVIDHSMKKLAVRDARCAKATSSPRTRSSTV
jgi:hypothetical protein